MDSRPLRVHGRKGYGGTNHYFHAMDRGSGFVYTADIRTKDEALAEALAYVSALRARGVNVRRLRFDAGREFTDARLRAKLAELGIHSEFVAPDRHLQDGERVHYITEKIERAVLAAAQGDVPRKYRNFANAYAAYVHNITRKAGGPCPYLLLFPGQRPDTSAFLPFGSQVAIYNSTRPNASYDRGLVATYLGPATDYGPGAVYALLNKQTVRVVASFKFLALPGHHLDPKTLRPPGVERPMPIDRHPAISEHEPERPARSARTRTPRRLFNPGQGGADGAWRDNATPVNVTIASAPDPAAILVEPPHRVFAGTELDQPALYDNDDARAAAAAHYPDGEAAPVVEPEAPTTLKAALAGDDAEAWCAAYVKQLDAFEEHDTCHPILCEDVPPNATIARSCMTFTVKRDGTKKARLCFDGSKVEKERRSKPDYGSVSSTTPRASSPTASYTSLTFLCAAAAHYGSTITQDDIDSAYLIGRRPTTAYMRFPYGHADWMRREFSADRSAWPYDPEKHVLAVDGNIWGHPDAGAIWFDVIMPFLLNELGFTPTPLDPCLLVRWDAGVPTLLLLFVDDYFIAAAADIAWAINAKISARFKTKGAHLADDALGVDIDMLPNGDVAIHSTSYLTRMLRRYGFSDCHPAPTPLEEGFTADPTHRPGHAGGSPSRSFDGAQVVGALVFASILRPDLSFAVSALASAVGCWGPKHDKAVSRVLRYIKGTLGRQIIFRHGAPPTLEAWVDASFANDIYSPASPGRAKSRSGCVVFFMGAVLWFFSRRQTATAVSTCEAELAALCLAARGIIVIRATIEYVFGIKLPETHVHEDNESTISIFAKRVVAGRMRHIRVNIGFVLDAIDRVELYLEPTRTRDQLANALTQSEGRQRHTDSVAKLFPHE